MRPFVVHDVEQGGDDWRALRLGLVTGSRAVDMLTEVKSGEAAGRRNLRTKLVLERVTQESQDDTFVSAAMRWGTEKEPEARALYQALTGQLVRRVGFVKHTTAAIGYSPDGVIGDFAGLIECKAPLPATHMKYLLTGIVPHEYLCQIKHGLYVTGAAFCDFVSYQPRFPPAGRLFMTRVDRKTIKFDVYEAALSAFLKEVDAEHASLVQLLEQKKDKVA